MRYTKGDNIGILIKEKRMKFYDEWFEYLEDRGFYESEVKLYKDVEIAEEEYDG